MKPQELKYIEHNKIEYSRSESLKDYKGVILNVSPEFVQGAICNSISWECIIEHCTELYKKELSILRDNKINQILS